MMHEVLNELTQQRGVKLAAVISGDGVPLCVLERASMGSGEFVDCTGSSQASLEGQRIDPASLVALAASWLDDVVRAGGQIAWEKPKRLILAASQGTLVVQQGPNAHAMAVLEPGHTPESVAHSLEIAVDRLQKLLRDLGRFDAEQNAAALPSAPVGAQPMQPPSAADYAAGGSLAQPATNPIISGPTAAATHPIDPSGTANTTPFDSTGDH